MKTSPRKVRKKPNLMAFCRGPDFGHLRTCINPPAGRSVIPSAARNLALNSVILRSPALWDDEGSLQFAGNVRYLVIQRNCGDSSPPKNTGLRMTVGALRGKTARQLSLSLLPRRSNNPSPGPRRLVKAPSRSTLSPRERGLLPWELDCRLSTSFPRPYEGALNVKSAVFVSLAPTVTFCS